MVGAMAAFGMLLMSGATHALAFNAFGEDLSRQALLPPAANTPVALVVTSLEIGLGVLGIMATAMSLDLFFQIATTGAALLFAAFTALLVILLHRRPGAPCGCGGLSRPANWWHVARSSGFLVGSLVAAASGGPHVLPLLQGACVLAAATTFSILLWVLPAAAAS